MDNSKSSILRRSVILIVMVFIMAVDITACGSENNTEFSNRYKFEVEKQTDDFYVNDFASIFSEADKQMMKEDAVEFAEKYNGIQIVVTTVNSLNGNGIEQYAYAMYEQYEISNMGILILLSVGDRDVRIETGKTMQAYITDSKAGILLDQYGMDYFREDKFAEGLKSVQQAVIQEIKKVVSINWNGEEENEMASSTAVDISLEDQTSDLSQNKKEKRGIINMIFAVVAIIEMAIIFTLLNICRKNKIFGSSNNRKNLKEIINQITIQNSELSEEIKKLNNKIEQEQANKEKMKSQYEQTFRELNEQINEMTKEKRELKKRITEIEEFYDRVSRLHPEHDFEKEVEAMIEAEFIATVESLNEQIIDVSNTPADKDRIEIFKNVINIYETAEPDVREAVTADIETVRKLYQKSINLQKRAEAIAKAAKIDERLSTVIALTADRNNIQIFGEAINEYDEADPVTKQFIKSNVSRVRSLYQESVRLHKAFEKEQQELRDKAEAKQNQEIASRAEENVQRAIRYIYGSAGEDDRDNISKAFRYYKSLSPDQKEYFSPELLNKMKRLREEAENDHEHKERIRRAHHFSDDFSVGSFNTGFGKHSSEDSNHHSGFGGHSSGGGASRHF